MAKRRYDKIIKRTALLSLVLGLFIIITSAKAYSDESVFFRGGPSIIDGSPSGQAKVFSVRKEQHEIYGIHTAYELGGWVDQRVEARKALFAKSQVGVTPGDDGLFAKAFIGPALISHTDALLGGHLQFATDIGFGVRDSETSVAIIYTHFSSAGLAAPNKGRDFLTLEAGVRF
jgi:hypothetical protein